MEQKGAASDGARKADPVEHIAPRPGVPERTESSLPPHLRPSVTGVPVTPDIIHEGYDRNTNTGPTASSGAGRAPEASYFSLRDADRAIAESPGAETTNREGQSFESKLETGRQEGSNYMRRVSVAVMGGPTDASSSSIPPGNVFSTPSRESMSDIRAISPDLALTGNIISATFNIPHSLKYRKGADWVCLFFYYFLSISLRFFAQFCPSMKRKRLPSLDRMVGLMSSLLCRN